MNNYVLIGPPGAGKGTLAKMMADEFGYIHLSTGELIRSEQAKDSPLGQLATKIIDQGNLLPDKLMIEIFQTFISENPTKTGYVFDGFPRTPEQAKHFTAFLLKSRIPFNAAVNLDVPAKVSTDRLLKRAELEDRKDDTPEVIKHRLGVYNARTKPVLKFFHDRGKLITVDGQGSPEEAYERLKDALALKVV